MLDGSVPVRLEPGTRRSVTNPLLEHVTPFHVETSFVVFQFTLAAGSHEEPEVDAKSSFRTCRLMAVSHAVPSTPQEKRKMSSKARPKDGGLIGDQPN